MVNVLNNEVETFQSMTLDVTIESLHVEFSKDIKVKTCPQRITGNKVRTSGLILRNVIFLSQPRMD